MAYPSRPQSQHSEQMKSVLNLLNEVFRIEKQLGRLEAENTIGRRVEKMRSIFEHDLLNGPGLVYEDPTGETYDETRTDCEATITGESADNLVIVETLKPIIRRVQGGESRIVQKGVVIVERQRAPKDKNGDESTGSEPSENEHETSKGS